MTSADELRDDFLKRNGLTLFSPDSHSEMQTRQVLGWARPFTWYGEGRIRAWSSEGRACFVSCVHISELEPGGIVDRVAKRGRLTVKKFTDGAWIGTKRYGVVIWYPPYD